MANFEATTINKLKRLFVATMTVVALSIVVAGCVTTKRDPQLIAALQGIRVSEVQVQLEPKVVSTVPLMNGLTVDRQAEMVRAALISELKRELIGYPGGTRPARLIVTVTHLDLASEQGRVLRSTDSTVEAEVRLEDARTRQLIAFNPKSRGADIGYKGGGLAIPIAMAVNAATTKSQQHLVEKLAAYFTQGVKVWLTPQ